MVPWLSFPIQIDKATWAKFKTRAAKDGLTAKAAIYQLIDYYIRHGKPPEKKDKS